MHTRSIYLSVVSLALAIVATVSVTQWRVPLAAQATVAVDADDIGGVVTGARGPEAGVWVIAESTDLPTTLRKIVVTDDQGRYLMPDLPKGNYSVWVRGYGLVDSAKVTAAPGKLLNITAVVAPTEKAAAEYYPSNYWFAMLKVPASSEFPIQDQSGKQPPDLTDDQWDHGSSDGEIFAVTKKGVGPQSFMAPWDGRISDAEIWNTINYIRSLVKRK
jgi:hypothetical protein